MMYQEALIQAIQKRLWQDVKEHFLSNRVLDEWNYHPSTNICKPV